MEANRIIAPHQGSLRTVIDRFRALGRRAKRRPLRVGPAARFGFEESVGAVDFLVHVDRDLRFLYVSDSSLRFIGYHREYLQTVTLHDLIAPADTARFAALLARANASGTVEKTTLDLIKSLTYPVSVELRVVRNHQDGVEGYAIAGFDVSSWRATEARLTHALHHDPLTGIANLSALVPALLDAQQRADTLSAPAALLLLDLDDYQRVNRALGYDAGDEMLRETARRVLAIANQGETIARIASDEFAIRMPSLTRSPSLAIREPKLEAHWIRLAISLAVKAIRWAMSLPCRQSLWVIRRTTANPITKVFRVSIWSILVRKHNRTSLLALAPRSSGWSNQGGSLK
ncbi:GGDEF domain-containing protein [Paraburkholderia megapolitana]|nr:GGDEF domain-containing protein [Paraburkholderia megapolitana]